MLEKLEDRVDIPTGSEENYITTLSGNKYMCKNNDDQSAISKAERKDLQTPDSNRRPKKPSPQPTTESLSNSKRVNTSSSKTKKFEKIKTPEEDNTSLKEDTVRNSLQNKDLTLEMNWKSSYFTRQVRK